MLYKSLVLSLLMTVSFFTSSFAQDKNSTTSEDNSNTSNSQSTSKVEPGVSYTAPNGSWVDIASDKSLAPYLINKHSEQLETKKKVTVIYSSSNNISSVLDILEGAKSYLEARWNNIKMIDPPHLESDKRAISGSMKYSTVYQLEDPQTGVLFRAEILVSTGWMRSGSRGTIYIITPLSKYFENRFFIRDIKNNLKYDESTAKKS